MKVEGGLSGNAQVLLAENWKPPLRVDGASWTGTNINFRFRSCLVTLLSLCNFRVGNFSIPMVKTFGQVQRYNVWQVMAHGRYLKVAHLWVVRKEERDEQPRRLCL